MSPEQLEKQRQLLGLPSYIEQLRRQQQGQTPVTPLEVLGALTRPLESVTAAPARAAVAKLQQAAPLSEVVEAFKAQMGKPPETAPSGEQLVQATGLGGKPAKVAGLGLEMAIDPTNLIGAGVAKAAVPLLGLAGALAKTEKLAEKAQDIAKAAKAADLPMDAASRLRRAEEMGFGTKGFHGSFRNIEKFQPDLADVEARFGKSIYISSSPEDASLNYASRSGPDPANKFSRKIDELLAKRDLGELPEDADLYELAAKELYGTSAAKAAEAGMVYPLRVKMKAPLRLNVKNPTYLDFTPKFDKNGDFVSESKLTNKLVKSLKSQAKDANFDADQVFAEITDVISDGEISASQLDDALRKSEALMYAENSEGKLVQSEVIRKIYEDLGFDGIVIDAKKTFPNMPNIPAGTEHFMVFKPTQIRSEFAKFDPSKAKSGVITAGGAIAVPALVERMRQQEREKAVGR